MEATVLTLVGILMISGALIVLNSAVIMFRVDDAYERLNAMTPATGFGLPLIVIGTGIEQTWEHGFAWSVWGRVVVIIAAMILVSSGGSNVLARAVYMSGAPLGPRVQFNDLAEDPDERDHDPDAPEPLLPEPFLDERDEDERDQSDS